MTLTDLEELTPNTVFAHGIDPQLGHWAAVRGDIPDWAAYAHPNPPALNTSHVYWVAAHGHKVLKYRAIQLVGADLAMAQRYRA